MEKKVNIIMAPHADDELIGCFTLLDQGTVHMVLVAGEKVRKEMYACADHYNFQIKLVDERNVYNFAVYARELGGNIYFPDPIYEWHPEHRFWGTQGEKVMRGGQDNVCFYSVQMAAPYIRESLDPDKKRQKLDVLYMQKKDLWKYDHKYFLFEGQYKWLTHRNLCQD